MTDIDREKSTTSPLRKPEKILRSRRIINRLSMARGRTYSASSRQDGESKCEKRSQNRNKPIDTTRGNKKADPPDRRLFGSKRMVVDAPRPAR